MVSWGGFFDRIARRRGLSSSDDPVYETVPWDGVPWHFAEPERIVAVGDVQGDLVALDTVLRETGLADVGGTWRGGRAHLVLLGDLVGGNDDARLVVSYVMRLEREAKRAGGAVHALLGNHDLLPVQGDTSRMTRGERRLYRRFPVPDAPGPGAKDAFRGESECARWVRGRNALLRLGDTLFVHAGLDDWFPVTDPGAVNATVRAWIRFWQGVGPRPPKGTRWAVGVPGMARHSRHARGPLWNRGFKPGERRGPSPKAVARWLNEAGLERVVLGHAPVASAEILFDHPEYGERVVLVDTRLSDPDRGRLSALVGERGAWEARYVKAKRRDPDCRERERTLLREEAARPAWLRLWNAFRDWF